MTHTLFWNLSETQAQHGTVLAPERRRFPDLYELLTEFAVGMSSNLLSDGRGKERPANGLAWA